MCPAAAAPLTARSRTPSGVAGEAEDVGEDDAESYADMNPDDLDEDEDEEPVEVADTGEESSSSGAAGEVTRAAAALAEVELPW